MDRATNVRLLRTMLNKAQHRRTLTGVTTAYTHYDDDDNAFTDVADHNNDNHIWVRLDDNDTQTLTQDARAPVSVWNFKVRDDKEGIFVILGYNKAGELRVVDVDEEKMSAAFAKNAATFATPRRTGALVNEVVPDRNFEPLRPRPNTTTDLTVYISPGRYEYADVSYWWDGSSTLDLSTISVSSNMKRAVIIGLDPITGLPTSAYGDEMATSLPDFTPAEYNDVINNNIGKVWLAGYQLENGVTAFTSIYDLIYFRAYLNPLGSASGAGFAPIDLDFDWVIPYNKQLAIRRLNITTGVLTVNGVLDVF